MARNAGLSALRHETVVRDKQDLVATALAPAEPDDGDIPDQRLRLIFTCCHPALAEEARVALTLHTLCGLPTPAIARLFFVSEATIAQRLVRAKRKIKASRIRIACHPPRRSTSASRRSSPWSIAVYPGLWLAR